jgi:hypothetical protein
MLAAVAILCLGQAPAPTTPSVLSIVRGLLMETIDKQRNNCASTVAEVCKITRLDTLEEVLSGWEDTPAYARYAVSVIEWQNNLSVTVANIADDYVVRHGALDAGFSKELGNLMLNDLRFQPPAEFVMRHLKHLGELGGRR